MSQKNSIRVVFIQGVFAFLLIAMLALAGRLTYIQLKKGEQLGMRADMQQQGYERLVAVRGTIYDRRGRILAGTRIVPSVYGDTVMIYDNMATAGSVGAVIGQPPMPLFEKLEKGAAKRSRSVWLARGIDIQAADNLMAIRKKDTTGLFLGINVQDEPKRTYTTGTVAGHVLGAVNIDGEGIEGIELYHNKLLRGKDGKQAFVRDAAGRKIWLIKDQCKSPINGEHIILSIDRVIQQFTQRILGQTCEYYKAESGNAIVMDPKTGDILAMAVWPEVDPNEFGNTPAEIRRNRAITDPFEPGSIFKPFIASHALQDGVTKLNDSIYCHNGAYTVGRRTLHDAHGLGTLTFQEVVSKSSNIGMAILGQRMGNAKLYEAVRAFGFGKKTGIDLRGEDPGIVQPFKRWTDYSTLSIPMGQEIACTSLQLVTAFAALSNDGQLLRPRVFRGAIDKNGQLIDEHSEPELMNQAVTPEIARTMVQEVMRLTVTAGTGKKADIPGYQVFGKTGTAQIAKSTGGGKGHYEDSAYVASFLGGAPSSDPQVVVTVNIRRPSKRIGHYGGTVSAPAVKEIINAYFDYMHIPPFEDPNKKPGDPTEKKVGGDDSTAE